MKKKSGPFKKVLALVMALGMALTIPQAASAAYFTDTDGHWAGPIIEQWAQYNILSGFGDGTVRPNDPITVAQLATAINRIMKYKTTAKTGFADVSQGNWYYEPLMALKGKGILNESENLAYPDKILTREEAVTIIAKAFRVTTNVASPSFVDAGDISPEARMYVAAMQNYGYVVGSNGYFQPKDSFTRAHIFTVLNAVAKNYISEPRAYTNLAFGNALANVPGASISRTTVNGDLYITPGVGAGNFDLDTVAVKGRMLVQGGGPNSIGINNSTIHGGIIVDNEVSQVRLVANNSTVEGILDINTDTILEGFFENVNITDNNVTVIIRGEVGTLHIQGSNVTVIVEKDGVVQTIYADPGSQGSVITGDGTANKIFVNANNITIKIANAEIAVSAGIEGTVAGTVKLAGGSTYSLKSGRTDAGVPIASSTGGASTTTVVSGVGSGGAGATFRHVTGLSIQPSDRITMYVNSTSQFTAVITPSDATNKTVTWESSNPSVASVSNNGMITANSAGHAIIFATSNDRDSIWGSVEVIVEGGAPTPTNIKIKGIAVTNKQLVSAGSVTVDAIVLPANTTEDKTVSWNYDQAPEGIVCEPILGANQLRVSGSLASGAAIVPSFDVTATSVTNPSISGQGTVYLLLEAGYYYVSGSVVDDVTGEAVQGATLTFKVAGTDVVEVSTGVNGDFVTVLPNGNYSVTITATNYSTADAIEVIVYDGDVYCAPFKLTKVEDPDPEVSVTAVSVDPKEIALKAHETKQLTASVKPENATNKNVSWTSSNELIATISQAGLVTAVAEGQAVITVTTLDGGKTDTCTVTVSNVPVGSYTVSGTVYTSVGDVKTPIADATVKLYNASGEVISEKTADTDGMYEFTGVADGGYKITAEAVGYRADELDVTVNGQDMLNQDIALEPETGLYSIYGDVLDAESGAGLAATVKLWKQGTLLEEAVANEKGYYEFVDLAPGEGYSVVSSMDGYIAFESGEKVAITDADVEYETINLERQSRVPPHLTDWLYDYEVTPNVLGYLTVIEVWLKPEFEGLVSITYNNDPFDQHRTDKDRYVYSFDEVGYDVDPLLIEVKNTKSIILDSSSAVDLSMMGTFAYVDIDSACGLDPLGISVTVDDMPMTRNPKNQWYFTSDSIPNKSKGDKVTIKAFNNGVEVDRLDRNVD